MRGRRRDRRDGSTEAELVRQRLGPGRALPPGVAQRVGRSIGVDPATVRVHHDGPAGAVAGEHRARAFTVGTDIGFAPGSYRPDTLAGQALLAHELAHVAQQTGPSGSSGATAASEPRLERAADRAAAGGLASAVLGGAPPARDGAGARAGGLDLQRCSESRYERDLAGVPVPPELADLDYGSGTTEDLTRVRDALQEQFGQIPTPWNERSNKYGVGMFPPARYTQWRKLIEKLNTRIENRGEPVAAVSPDIALRFDGSTLQISGGSSQSFPAVSGRPVEGRFDYSPERQRVMSAGPIPAGRYWIHPPELSPDNLLRPESAWGSHRITIHPYGSTPTFGRGGFFIHGGDVPGSAGCIDLTDKMPDFARAIESASGTIELTVEYPEPAPGATGR